MAKSLVPAQAAPVAIGAADELVAHNAILEFQSPTLAIVAAPAPFSARMTIWLVTTMVIAIGVVLGTFPSDRTVAVAGVLLAQSPNVIVQPLETAIVRKIVVREGQTVKKGDLLAELDPTFAGSDAQATTEQMASMRAQVERLRAELANKPYISDGTPYGAREEIAYIGRHQQFVFTLENYNQQIASLQAKVDLATADVASLGKQVAYLQSMEDMRHQLERLQVGAKLNTRQAELDREAGQQKLDDARHALDGARRDLAAEIATRDAWKHQWYADAQDMQSQQERLLADMEGQVTKNRLRRKLVDLRAEADSIVLSVSRVSPGTVLASGIQLMTTVPVDAPLEVVALIDGANDGFVKAGDRARVKFDTLPYFRYGFAEGHVERVSADSFVDPTQGQVNPQTTAPSIDPTSPGANGVGIYYYRAFITIDKMRLRRTPESFRLKPGMPLEVDINVGQRTLLEYFLEKFIPFMAQGATEPS